MSTLKELKVRINSVKSTKKITKVMKMVAATKLRKAQKKALDAMPCSVESKNLINKIISTIPENELPKLLKGSTDTKTQLLFIIASDKGLCGRYNTSIIKLVKQHLKKIVEKGVTPKLVCIGAKAGDLLTSEFDKYIIKSVKKINVNYETANELMSSTIKEHDFDSVKIFYTKFENTMSQIPTEEQIVPFEKTSIQPYQCKYEPDQSSILNDLIVNNLAIQFYKALSDSHASEYIARMMVMDNATRNANEMIKKLTLHYNRSRQAAITTELIEIISGAEVV